MAHIFITTEFDRIDKSNWPPFVKDFLANPNVGSLHDYNHTRIYFKKLNSQGYPRVMFLQEKRNDITLYIPRLYFKNHDEYTKFLNLSESEMIKKGKYSESESIEIDAEFRRYETPDVLPDLPNEMRDFESKRDFSNISTSYVFEMEEWVRHIKSVEFADDKRSIHELLQQIIVEKKYDEPDSEGWVTMSFQPGKYIVARISVYEGHTYIYLFDVTSNTDKRVLNQKYLNDNISDEVLLKKARKGYPDWIMYGDFEDWKKLEEDDEANLALSDEEVRVLNNTPYPYFVNGLAGSGKSTVLYYLFAHAYAYKQFREQQSLLFLSYSKKLTKKAQDVVLALLRTNPSYSGYRLNENDKEALNSLNECFCPFIDFLKNNFLNTKEEIERFEDEKHISFERFQRMYKNDCQLVEANGYSATIVWSVIRSFIKGRHYCPVKVD